MNKIIQILFLIAGLAMLLPSNGNAQTLIAKEQIEDAFLMKTGGNVYGDIQATTSTIKAKVFHLQTEDGVFCLMEELPNAVIRSNHDLVLDPTNNGTASAVIVPTTTIRFLSEVGDKIQFYSHSFKIGVSPFDLDITSDRNIKFHSDTVEDLMVIEGDQGDVLAKQDMKATRDLRAGNVIGFTQDTLGDKVVLYGTVYKLSISANTMDFHSDREFAWHSDSASDAMHLNADTGVLSLTGPLQLPVYTSLPGGAAGHLIYFDHPTDDNQDGAYVYTGTGWQQL